MKDKKIISYKSEKIKRIAYNLRSLLTKAVMQEWSRLGDKRSQAGRFRIENKRTDLYSTLHASICICSACNQIARDMVYNAPLREWYCTLCVQEYREYYQRERAIYGDLAEDGDFFETFFWKIAFFSRIHNLMGKIIEQI